MKLIRDNKEKQRSVYYCGNCYHKVWNSKPAHWVKDHVDLLNKVVPGHVLDFGDNWIDYAVIPGTLVSQLPHTMELMQQVYNFCLENIEQTYPYAHGDWALSNMLIENNAIRMCDWDNLGIYTQEEVYAKLHQDLLDSFGSSFLELIK
jgi:RIO-like serine/threonine protein kinase